MSMPPSLSATWRAISRAGSGRVKSAATHSVTLAAAAARSRFSRLRDAMATLAPSARKARAQARPIPLLPPVTRTTLPSRSSFTMSPRLTVCVDYRWRACQWQQSVRRRNQIRQRDPAKHCGADPIVIVEGAEAAARIAAADQRVLIEHQRECAHQPGIVWPAKSEPPPDAAHDAEERGM